MYKYQIIHKYQDSNWAPTNLYSSDLKSIIQSAANCAKDVIAYGMTAVWDVKHHTHIVEFSAGDAKTVYIDPNYRFQVYSALEQQVEVQKVEPVNKCPDCQDGFYYPLVGPKEPCPTCSIQTQESSDSIFLLQQAWDNIDWSINGLHKVNSNCQHCCHHILFTIKYPISIDIRKVTTLLINKIMDATQIYQTKSFYTDKYYPDFEINTCAHSLTIDLSMGFP